jgi:hypothetical protein
MKISSGHFINFDLTKSICENSTIDPLTGIEPVVLRFHCSAVHDLAVKLVDNWTLQLRWSESIVRTAGLIPANGPIVPFLAAAPDYF